MGERDAWRGERKNIPGVHYSLVSKLIKGERLRDSRFET